MWTHSNTEYTARCSKCGHALIQNTLHATRNEDTLKYYIHYTLLEMRTGSTTEYTTRCSKWGHAHL